MSYTVNSWTTAEKEQYFICLKLESKPAKESKEKLSEKKTVYYSIKNFKPEGTSVQQYHSNMPASSQNKDAKPSPFKHKHTKNKSTYAGSINFVSHGLINPPNKSIFCHKNFRQPNKQQAFNIRNRQRSQSKKPLITIESFGEYI